jgi:hypothetical protein
MSAAAPAAHLRRLWHGTRGWDPQRARSASGRRWLPQRSGRRHACGSRRTSTRVGGGRARVGRL